MSTLIKHQDKIIGIASSVVLGQFPLGSCELVTLDTMLGMDIFSSGFIHPNFQLSGFTIINQTKHFLNCWFESVQNTFVDNNLTILTNVKWKVLG